MLIKKSFEHLVKLFRRILSGKDVEFKFISVKHIKMPPLSETSIYVHIPFCKNLCPYCPYNRIPYDSRLIRPYVDALIKEIEGYSKVYEKTKITSVYFGGGTPTIIGDELTRITNAIRKNFNTVGDFCIETNPNDISEKTITVLNNCGFNSISIGVQSFNEKLLNSIGRKYNKKDIHNAIMLAKNNHFDTINIDLLFALPGQKKDDLANDIKKVLEYCPDQITYYPLFTFPYSEISEYKQIKYVKSPSVFKRRKMYYQLYDTFKSNGYSKCSVWSFKKDNNEKKYSSVTRERYLGFGASSGSYYETHFTLNTFSVPEYISSINSKGNAISLTMNFTKRLSILYDFYWRLYDTIIPKKRNLEFSSYSVEKNTHISKMIKIFLLLKWMEKGKNEYRLTRNGCLWVHFIQNMFSLSAINTIWSAGKKYAWPKEIKF